LPNASSPATRTLISI